MAHEKAPPTFPPADLQELLAHIDPREESGLTCTLQKRALVVMRLLRRAGIINAMAPWMVSVVEQKLVELVEQHKQQIQECIDQMEPEEFNDILAKRIRITKIQRPGAF